MLTLPKRNSLEPAFFIRARAPEMMGPFRATWDEEDVQCIGKKRRTDISLPSTKAACFARNLHNDSVSTRMCIRDEMCVELEIARGKVGPLSGNVFMGIFCQHVRVHSQNLRDSFVPAVQL